MTGQRFVRYLADGGPAYGVIGDGAIHRIDGHPFGGWTQSDEEVSFEGLRLLAPVIPTKIVCVGKNYRDHAAEMGGEVPTEPLLFLKPSSSIIGLGDQIVYPTGQSSEVHHEAELAVVIGKTLRRATPDQARDAVLGVTAANDVTARDLQRSDGQWTRAKGFDTFCPLGPSLATGVDTSDLEVICRVDGVVKQRARTSDMVFDISTLLAYISGIMTLLPTDVVLTGTPAGVGPISPGQVVEVEIEGVGSLVNPVVAGPSASTKETL